MSNSQDPVIIHMWSAPRSLSTCTMYSFSRRPDTKVYDEPLAAHWAFANPHIPEFNREQLIATGVDSSKTMNEMIDYSQKRVVFAKQIAHQLIPEMDRSLLFSSDRRRTEHIFLLRDPLECIARWDALLDMLYYKECSMETLGFLVMDSLYQDILKHSGKPPIVIDSNMLKEQPKFILQKLCEALGIEFYDEQLTWPAGPKPDIDGPWGIAWYTTAHKSTGFSTWAPGTHTPKSTVTKLTIDDLTPSQAKVYKEALPLYEKWMKHAIKLETKVSS